MLPVSGVAGARLGAKRPIAPEATIDRGLDQTLPASVPPRYARPDGRQGPPEPALITHPSGRERVPSGEAFQHLLSSLDSDPLRAGEKYEGLRRRLINFFLSRRGQHAEESADETLDRLGRRLAEGERIHELGRFAYGVARRVHSEDLRRLRRRRRALQALAGSAPEAGSAFESDVGVECIRQCIEELDVEDRRFIVEYYDGSGRDLQQGRKELADRLGITPSALRLRSYRLRRLLEESVRKCLQGRDEAGARRGARR
jgi:DNA-directed RNA polymerase specialized sigma24 family protein